MTELTKPGQVVTAGRIMWTLWAAGGGLLLIGLVSAIVRSQPGVMILTVQFLIVMALLGLLIRAVLMGKNWARIVYAVMACFVMGAVSLSLASRPQVVAKDLALAAVLIVAYSIILGLLFHRDAAAWFRSRKSSN
jgi:hypothetical protein